MPEYNKFRVESAPVSDGDGPEHTNKLRIFLVRKKVADILVAEIMLPQGGAIWQAWIAEARKQGHTVKGLNRKGDEIELLKGNAV